VVEFWDWMRDRLEELDANRSDDDDTEYLSLLPRALEWQRWLLIHALELLDGPGCVFRFRTVLLLVARQNGKSVLLTALILWRMFQDGARMVLETHASNEHARAAWEEAVAIAEAIPELADDIAKVQEGKNSELLLLDGGQRFKIATANRRGGRGFRGDLIIFDELREHQDWRAWSATSKTTMARKRAQVWGVSNAGDMSSVVLRHLRSVAIGNIAGRMPDGIPAEIADQIDLDSIGLFEWSAGTVDGTEDGQPVSIWDREGWARANPSLGYTELDERAIAAAAASDPEWEFRTEVLCQFVNMIGAGPFPNGSWAAITDPKGDRVQRGVTRDLSRPACYGVDMSESGHVHVALAFWDTEGRIRGEIVAHRAGPDWVIPWLLSPARKVHPDHVAFQRRGAPISSLWKDFDEAGITVTPWGESELAGWHRKVYQLVKVAAADEAPAGEAPEQFRERVRLSHGVQPLLDTAAASAQIKTVGDGGWVIDRTASPADAAPLVAFIAAVGLLLTNPAPQTVSAYESHDLMVV
jgi:phage terminase large subunit-like protein